METRVITSNTSLNNIKKKNTTRWYNNKIYFTFMDEEKIFVNVQISKTKQLKWNFSF